MAASHGSSNSQHHTMQTLSGKGQNLWICVTVCYLGGLTARPCGPWTIKNSISNFVKLILPQPFLIEEIWTAGTALSCSTTWSLFKSNVKSVNSFALLCDSYSATYFMSFTSNTQPSSLEWKLEEKGFWPQISTNLTKTGHLHFIVWLHPLGYSNQPWGPYIGSKLLRLWIPHEPVN